MALGLETDGEWGQRSGFLGGSLQNVDRVEFPSVRRAERALDKEAPGEEAPVQFLQRPGQLGAPAPR